MVGMYNYIQDIKSAGIKNAIKLMYMKNEPYIYYCGHNR